MLHDSGYHLHHVIHVCWACMQPTSVFAKAYFDGCHKSKYWEPVLEDSLNLIAKLPAIAAHIYRTTYHGESKAISADASLDWAGNLSHMMGVMRPPPIFTHTLTPSCYAHTQTCRWNSMDVTVATLSQHRHHLFAVLGLMWLHFCFRHIRSHQVHHSPYLPLLMCRS